jgi:hypothetical protein
MSVPAMMDRLDRRRTWYLDCTAAAFQAAAKPVCKPLREGAIDCLRQAALLYRSRNLIKGNFSGRSASMEDECV